MKKIFTILTVLIFTIGINAHAQKGKELIFGLGGGITNTWIINQNFYGEPEVDYAPKMGYAASFNLGFNFTENIAVMTELQYSAQGQKYSGSQSFDGNNFTTVERDIKLNYLNIPVFFKYMFGEGNTRFRLMGGPQFGILMDATQDYLRDGKVQPTYIVNADGDVVNAAAKEIKDRYESLDIGVAFDFGADINLSDQFFVTMGMRFNYGFKDINVPAYHLDNSKGEPYDKSNNLWGGLYVGINYRLDVEGYSQRSF
jgi:hypothetical protein